MIYVAALDPSAVSHCANNGALGGDHLVGILQALLQNCLMAEISGTWRISEDLKNEIQAIKDQDTRKKASALMEAMLKPDNCKFIEVITGFEDDFSTNITDILKSQSSNDDLDAVITENKFEADCFEVIPILSFNQSNFAKERSNKAIAIVYAPDTKAAPEVLNEAFKRAVMHSDCVEIYDRQMGISMGSNYYDAIEHWCDFFLSLNKKLELKVHTTETCARSVKGKFSEHLDDTNIRLRVYAHPEIDQPHDRFLRASGFTFDLGRGVDLFKRSGKCRDVKIGLSNHREFTKQWGPLTQTSPI